MTKQEALNMVLKMLSDGEIQYEFGGLTSAWDKACTLDSDRTFRIKPAKLFGVEIPRPLNKEELEGLRHHETVFTIALWNKDGIGSVNVAHARDNFTTDSVVYKTSAEAKEAVKALRNA